MIDKNPWSDFSKDSLWLSEQSLHSEAIRKFISLWVTEETATKLAGLREEMDPETEKTLEKEFQALSPKELQDKMTAVKNIHNENIHHISQVAAFETSQLRKILSTDIDLSSTSKPRAFSSSRWFISSMTWFWTDLVQDIFESALHPVDWAKYAFHQASRKLTPAEFEYKIPETSS